MGVCIFSLAFKVLFEFVYIRLPFVCWPDKISYSAVQHSML